MKAIRLIGLSLFLVASSVFLASITLGQFMLTPEIVDAMITDEAHKQALLPALEPMLGKTYDSNWAFVAEFEESVNGVNEQFKKNKEWGKVIYTDYTLPITKSSSKGVFVDNQGIFFFLSIIMGIVGALLYIVPKVKVDGPAGIKHNGIFHHAATSKGWIGVITGSLLILFYVLLYYYPYYITNWILMFDPISYALNGGAASQWFLYGFLYCVAMSVMGVRMLIKYRHSRYQLLRTGSVIFFQLTFAFLIPQLLARLNLPAHDLKNMWPLDYSFFFDYRLDKMLASGTIGLFMLVWGIVLFVIGVPVMVYFFGKRWYCSWVCGCGGLAETLGDPYRQLSDKSLKAWQVERWLIHSVGVFALFMTTAVLYTYFSGDTKFVGLDVYQLRSTYGFLIGGIFAGVVGTGFYPLMGNRVWCRFGCPLAAYLGMVQRFKSRFRITTNGGQCISCGNCSTYCEMGIDVRWYAQRGQNIVRSSCVGCGVCSAVCPRGVLNLENDKGDSIATRAEAPAIIIGRDEVKINQED